MLPCSGLPADLERCRQLGLTAYLTKPIKVDEFMNTLDAALEFAGKANHRG